MQSTFSTLVRPQRALRAAARQGRTHSELQSVSFLNVANLLNQILHKEMHVKQSKKLTSGRWRFYQVRLNAEFYISCANPPKNVFSPKLFIPTCQTENLTDIPVVAFCSSGPRFFLLRPSPDAFSPMNNGLVLVALFAPTGTLEIGSVRMDSISFFHEKNCK